MGSTVDLSPYREIVDGDWDSYEALYDHFEWAVPDRFNLAHGVCDRWAEDGDRVAIYELADDGTERAYTFRELRTESNRLARFFESRGVEAGDRICVSGSQSATTMIGHLAAWKLGAISVPLSVLLGPDGLSYRLADCDASAFVVDDQSVETLREIDHDLSHVVVPDETEPEPGEVTYSDATADRSESFQTADTAADDGAIIIYTSGTTGQPKGALHAHRTPIGVLPCVLLGAFNLELRPDDVGRTAVEWSWAGALTDFVLPHWLFGKPVVARSHREFDPEVEFELIDRFDVSVYNAPPTALRLLSQADDPTDRHDLGSIRALFSGGEAVSQRIFDWADEVFDDAALQQGYGQTEAPGFVGDCEALELPYKHGKIGRPSPGNEVEILDPETGAEPVEDGEVGEIALSYDGNPGCFLEYWNKPEKTEKKIQDGWLLSEDLGRRTDDGYIVFEGRKDDVIICSGYKIGPEEIEDVLTQHEAVRASGVIGVPDETRGEIPKAFVELVDEDDPSSALEAELKEFVKERLAKYEYPRAIEFIDEVPKTTSGKIQRGKLRTMQSESS